MIITHLLILGLLLGVEVKPSADADYSIRPVPFTAVRLADEFWSPWMETHRTVTVPYCLKLCEETGRIDNFAIAGRLKEGKFTGYFYNDSDVFKVIEGAAYLLAVRPDPALDARLDDIIAKIAAAQEPDGYLYTARTLAGPDTMPPGGKERWSDMAGGHELYNVGHLYEAAVAHHLATGKRTLLDVALKNADLVCKVFGPGRNPHPCGHQEIEIGLCKLYRDTGERRYLEMAQFFLDTRGRAEGRTLYGEYSQDHLPVLEQQEAVGHAVRAGYMYAAMADVAALAGRPSYLEASRRLWESVTGRKQYVTGGVGARAGGEAFGEDYELPAESAYAETCAAIANVLWNHRLFLSTGDAAYLDVLERVLYNAILPGVSLGGDRFFYVNPLASFRGEERRPWFDCACCPSNIARFMPQIPGMAYAVRDNDVYVNLFMGGSADVKLKAGTVRLTQETRYPWDGKVRVTVAPEAAPMRFGLWLRIPGWARNRPVPTELYHYASPEPVEPSLKLNGEPIPLVLDQGFVRIEREWTKADVIELDLPMPVRRIRADARVTDTRGRVALKRGPIVFCVEEADNPGSFMSGLVLDESAPMSDEFRRDLLGGVWTLRGRARSAQRGSSGEITLGAEQDITAVPYFAWANRQRGSMTVWLASDAAAAQTPPSLPRASFGAMPDGRPVELFTLTNARGMRVRLTNYGAITVSVEVPDRKGKIEDVTLGYDTLPEWLKSKDYFGATVGRYANRIAEGRFTLDGNEYRLATNNGENHLHGGIKGFDKVLWTAEPLETRDRIGVRFTYLSPDGEEGYPGNLKIMATYTLTNANEYEAEFSATTDKPTIVNVVNHTYWNLRGPPAGDILGHQLMIAADRYTPVDAGLIPTGELAPVKGTPMDFTSPLTVGARIGEVPGGYDHNFVLNKPEGALDLAVRVLEPDSGRVMEIRTDQPGVQFYSGNFLDGSVVGKGGVAYRKHGGFCLETQHYPDSPNRPAFPSVVLRPGETYRHRMVIRFTVE